VSIDRTFNAALNTTRSGGEFDVEMRRLQTYTIHEHQNGTFYVTDDRQQHALAGAGFPTIEATVAWYKPFDHRRVSWY
jgi:hypothetical protein